MDSNPEAPERGGPPGGPVPGKRLCVPQERPGSPGDLRSEERSSSAVDVSIILPVHNAACWLDDSLGSVLEQDFQGSMELSVFNDASQDDSLAVIERWTVRLQRRGIPTVLSGHRSPQPRGVGYAKNQAVAQSQGRYLCFLDADDIMSPQRVSLQHHAALQHPDCIVGCQVRRLPEGSTERYTRWINSLTQEQLLTQVYTSHGPTVIMPTWFCGRSWFEHVGKFDEGGRGVPEDLLFFYASLRRGVGLLRLDHCLLTYRHHPQAASLAVHEETIWSLRVGFLQERVLSQWDSFTIWNAGKQGRKLYRSLSPACRSKVVAFCDIDEKKIEKGYYTYEDSEQRPKPRIPVRHFRDASPPFIICVKLDMTGGDLEENLHSLNLKEGLDYFHFN